MLDYVLGEFFIHLDCFIYIYTYIIIIDEYVCTYAIATFHLLRLADELHEVSEQTLLHREAAVEMCCQWIDDSCSMLSMDR